MSTQAILVYSILAAAVIYLGYRAYVALFKKKAGGCANCPANETV